MKVLFYSVKGAGHVNPTLPVVRALIKAGHEVFYSVTLEWQDRIEATGATFLNTGGSGPFTTATYHPDSFFLGQLIPTAAAIAPRLVNEARGIAPDLIVYDSAAVWGPIVAGEVGCPAVTSFASLIFDDLSRLGVDTDALGADEVNLAAVKEIKERYGKELSLKKVSSLYSPDALVFSCPSLNCQAKSLGLRTHFVGSSAEHIDSERQLKEHDLAHLMGEAPLVYVSMGTVAIEMMKLGAEFFRPFIEAISESSGRQLLISTSQAVDPEELGTLPAHVTARKSVPQVAVLQHTEVFVTHAGSNSMHEALSLDLPLLCVPCFADQPFNASQIESLGAGLQLSLQGLNSEGIAAAVETLSGQPSYRAEAKKLGAELRAGGGAQAAVKVLEAVASGA